MSQRKVRRERCHETGKEEVVKGTVRSVDSVRREAPGRSEIEKCEMVNIDVPYCPNTISAGEHLSF